MFTFTLYILKNTFLLLTFLKQPGYFGFRTFKESYYFKSLRSFKYQTHLRLNSKGNLIGVLITRSY